MGFFFLCLERPKDDNVVTLEMLRSQVSLRTGEQVCLEKNDYTQYKMFFPPSNEAIIKRATAFNVDDAQNIYCIKMIVGGGMPLFYYLCYCIYLAAVDLGFEPIRTLNLEECSWYGKKWYEADSLNHYYIFKVDRNLDIISPEVLSQIDENGFYI
jgi:hypothetical protein